MSMISPVGPVYQAGTLSGNPLAMAGGIATLEIEAKKRPRIRTLTLIAKAPLLPRVHATARLLDSRIAQRPPRPRSRRRRDHRPRPRRHQPRRLHDRPVLHQNPRRHRRRLQIRHRLRHRLFQHLLPLHARQRRLPRPVHVRSHVRRPRPRRRRHQCNHRRREKILHRCREIKAIVTSRHIAH